MKKHDELMELLETVDGVKDHINSLSVVLGLEILKLRNKQELSHKELSSLSGLDEELIVKVEYGDKDVEVRVYDKVFKALGIDSIEIQLNVK